MNGVAIGALVAAGVAGVIALSTLFGSFYTVNEGERGIVKYLGAVVGVAQPGFNWKLPWLVDVPTISVRAQSTRWEGLTSYTKDQQVATSAVSVNWHIDDTKVADIYKVYGSAENLAQRALQTRVTEQLETVFGQYNADRAVADRAGLSLAYSNAIKAVQASYPIIIDSVQIENFDLPVEYEQRINEKMAAEVEVKKLEQKALQAKQNALVTVTEAQARADSQLAEAKANAESVRLKGEAEASAIAAKGKALRDNPGLVDLIKAETWNGVLPTTMLPGDVVPFIDTTPKVLQ